MRKTMVAALLLLGVCLFSVNASAQSPVAPCVTIPGTFVNSCQPVTATNPFPITGTISTTTAIIGKTTTETKVTIAVTNTYQQALASSGTRTGCLIQNNGTNTGYVFFGAAPADRTTSFQLAAGQAISCAIGGIAVATDAVQVTGTSGDVFVVSSQ